MPEHGTLLAIFQSRDFFLFAAVHIAYMTVLWGLRVPLKNAGLVDWGWPSGFLSMAIFFATKASHNGFAAKALPAFYIICGARFLLGWIVRDKKYGEDRRWNLWRERWSAGEGLLGVKNISVNFFFFYQAQAVTNVFVFSIPLILVCFGPEKPFGFFETTASLLWLISFVCENISDHQLRTFKSNKSQRGLVCKDGFWRYSRHPNYFFELGIWSAYALFAVPHVQTIWEGAALAAVPALAYFYLVAFTGIPMNEKASLLRRGAIYAEYQRQTNRFFPWFPKP
jgi:steroid 5-alpha reductase family enzyme